MADAKEVAAGLIDRRLHDLILRSMVRDFEVHAILEQEKSDA